MRTLLVIVGVVIALMGVLWALQGLGIVLGSFMSNNPPWIAIGSVTAIIGAGLVLAGIRTGAPSKGP